MKRYQCGDFGWPGQRPWAPPGCGPPPCPPPCPPGQTPCPPPQDPCPPQEPCVSGCVPTPWVLGGYYRAGQLVTYNGYLYVANRDNAAGTPGASADFTLLSTLQPVGPTGPAGVPGPTGPTEAGKDGQRPGKSGGKRQELMRFWCRISRTIYRLCTGPEAPDRHGFFG